MRIKALNLNGNISNNIACQNIITESIIAIKNHIKPLKNGCGLLYI